MLVIAACVDGVEPEGCKPFTYTFKIHSESGHPVLDAGGHVVALAGQLTIGLFRGRSGKAARRSRSGWLEKDSGGTVFGVETLHNTLLRLRCMRALQAEFSRHDPLQYPRVLWTSTELSLEDRIEQPLSIRTLDKPPL